MTVRRDQLVGHVAALTAATTLPINVDAEQCFPRRARRRRGDRRAARRRRGCGCSIEDLDPSRGASSTLTSRPLAWGRLQRGARRGPRAHRAGENHLRGVDDLDDTVARLRAYRDAGADVVYAPVLPDLAAIKTGGRRDGRAGQRAAPPGGPTRDELAAVGVRRLSVGGTLASIAYGALAAAASSSVDAGGSPPPVRAARRRARATGVQRRARRVARGAPAGGDLAQGRRRGRRPLVAAVTRPPAGPTTPSACRTRVAARLAAPADVVARLRALPRAPEAWRTTSPRRSTPTAWSGSPGREGRRARRATSETRSSARSLLRSASST